MVAPVNVVILGATGLVGEAFLEILAQRDFPVNTLYALASAESAGKVVYFKNKRITVQNAEDFDFSQAQIGLFSAGSEVSAKYVPRAAAAGCVVIDNTAKYRYEPKVPLVIPEINPEAISAYKETNIIANPNCATIQMLVALKPIYDAVGITKIHAATYQSVSGTGRDAVNELAKQTVDLINGYDIAPEVYPCQIAFNVIPHIDIFLDNGFTKEEMKMVWETKKIFNDQQIAISTTAVRVPVFHGHAIAVHLETKQPIKANRALELLKKAPGVKVIDDLQKSRYPTPAIDAVNKDAVYVGRVRNDLDNETGLNLWIVADNIRKGAALNSIQIAEILLNKYLGL